MAGVFLGLLAGGIIFGATALLGRRREGPHQVLGEGLARGEVSPDEFRERLAVIGPRPHRVLTPIALVLTTTGLIGTLVVGAMAGP